MDLSGAPQSENINNAQPNEGLCKVEKFEEQYGVSLGFGIRYDPVHDDKASYHEDASDSGTATNKPKQQQQQVTPTITTISNIKLPILKKEEYDYGFMEMEHTLNILIMILEEIHAVEKERKARTILLMAIPKGTSENISWNG
ncbi:hypothetical protein Tco_0993412 [Tanacetum coccineum]|uniref:Uncharacterized protein n=1 Tax=Tanacetum coccineum TaxID=301880 RepID=A0ABQ5F5G2_9ASTR